MSNNTTFPQTIGTREDRGKAIAEKNGNILRINDKTYKVRSQSGNGIYDIISTEIGWKCSCPDHQIRGVKCKHIFAVDYIDSKRKDFLLTFFYRKFYIVYICLHM